MTMTTCIADIRGEYAGAILYLYSYATVHQLFPTAWSIKKAETFAKKQLARGMDPDPDPIIIKQI